MNTLPLSIFAANRPQCDLELIEKFGITPADVYRKLLTIISSAERSLEGLYGSHFARPQKVVYHHKFDHTLNVEVIYTYIQKVHCVFCENFQVPTVTYTFKNVHNHKNFSVTNLQVHHLMHGNFKSLKQDPFLIHSVLEMGYYSGEF